MFYSGWIFKNARYFLSIVLFFSVMQSQTLFAASAPEKPSFSPYVSLAPAFVVNIIAVEPRFLRVEVTLKVKDQKTEEAVKKHTPQIRHLLLMLFSAQDEETLLNSESRELLKQNALEKIKDMLKDERSDREVEEILFTEFIVE
jgi:flagellar FliL protein